MPQNVAAWMGCGNMEFRNSVIDRLNLLPAVLEAIRNTPLPENHGQIKDLFFNDPNGFREYALHFIDGLTILSMYIEWLPDTKLLYDSHNIPESYFWNSIREIKIWSDDFYKKNKVPGFSEWEWVGRTLRLEVVRIGRLQFLPTVLRENITICDCVYEAGTPVLDVHIPAGEGLHTADVMTSLMQAPLLFKKYFKKEFVLFHCNSWLLSPTIRELLPEKSRIIQFQNLFNIYKTDNVRQAEERVFGFIAKDASLYPENTFLQRTLKQSVLAGKTVGMAAGIRKI